MKDFEFDYNSLTSFSNEAPYLSLSQSEEDLLISLESLQSEKNFPAINKDIGSFINFMMSFWRPESVFEMGSGYGHSSFWYFACKAPHPKKVYLTEKRDDLVDSFESLPWPVEWKEKIEYYNDDAFNVLKDIKAVDLALIDGVKANYLDFLKEVFPKMSKGGVVLIDNSFWRGSFLDKEISAKKESARKIKELHDFIAATDLWHAVFIPYIDGLTVLQKI